MATVHDAVLQLRPDLLLAEARIAAVAVRGGTWFGAIPRDMLTTYILPMINCGRHRFSYGELSAAHRAQSAFNKLYDVRGDCISRRRLRRLHPELDASVNTISMKCIAGVASFYEDWKPHDHPLHGNVVACCEEHLAHIMLDYAYSTVEYILPCGLMMFSVVTRNAEIWIEDVLIDPITLRHIALQPQNSQVYLTLDDYGEYTEISMNISGFYEYGLGCSGYHVVDRY